MHVKKNLMLWAAAFALVLPLMFVGTASATYLSDGATQSDTSGGWDMPADMGVCVTAIAADGTITVDSSIHSRPDCLAKTFPAYTTNATCGDTANADGAHFWATSCVATDGTAISLTGLDRTDAMCAQAAAKLGKTAVALSMTKGHEVCTSAWQYLGRTGTANAENGFCYTKVNVTTAPGYSISTGCPSGTTPPTAGYSWSTTGPQCVYAYGIAGYANAALKDLAGSTVTAANAFVDLSAKTTMGQCLLVGGSWKSYETMTGTVSPATTPLASTIADGVVAGNWDCLRCHNSTSQNNSMAGRWKESALKMGHKNMLRKVTVGKAWAGPDGVPYTTDGTNAIDFATGTINVSGTDRTLYYVYGDWMAALPSVVYSNTTGTTNGYSCAACHTTGFSNVAANGGVCAPDSTKKTVATCTSPNTWYPSTGVQGVAGLEPDASFNGINLGITAAYDPRWDQNGIVCSRCHASTWPAVYNSSNVAITAGGHDFGGAIAKGNTINNLCFGCHQSAATTYVAATIQGIATPAGAVALDPTMIPTGVSHGAAPGRDFNGHVLGNSFLNSVHSRFTGTMVPNALGKYDIAGGTYDSAFKGFVCRSAANGGGSQLETVLKSGVTSEITNASDCNVANGVASNQTTTAFWQAAEDGRGSCTTCHDVHNSLFVTTQAEKALKTSCADCHVNNSLTNATDPSVPTVNMGTFGHPKSTGTPFDTSKFEDACVVCHMGTQALANGDQNSMPAHVWRINTSATYNTFPTVGQFYGGLCSAHTSTLVNAATSFMPAIYASDTTSALCASNAGTWTAVTKDRAAQTAPDGTYTNAVWVDLDMACGQCHGGSAGSGATHNGAMFIPKANLAGFAAGIHTAGTISIPPPALNTPPVANGSVSVSGYNVTLVDSSSDAETASADLKVLVNWGDGKVGLISAGSTTTHTYTRVKLFTILQTVTDKGDTTGANVKSTSKKYANVAVPTRVTVGGTATTGTVVSMKKNGHTVKATKAALGAYSFTGVLPGTYTIRAYLRSLGTTTTPEFTVVDTDVTQNLP